MFKDYNCIYNLLCKKKYTRTCSAQAVSENSILFLSKKRYIEPISSTSKRVAVITQQSLYSDLDLAAFGENVFFIPVDFDDAFYIFAKIHNLINKDIKPKKNIFGTNVSVHKTSALDMDGQRVAKSFKGESERLKHMGNVVLGDNVVVDAFTSIHRASFDSTIIGAKSTICSHVNIGHNCILGEDVFVGPGAKIAGSVTIGDRCNIWQGSLVRNGIKICSDVTIGMGSVVTKDILEPGVYFGSPCKKKE
jgi:acetyltransferase-like isoleucine patch superfamily enzyme